MYDVMYPCVSCSRRRSSSLGSCDEERVELSAAQLSKKIHSLKKKISRFEDKYQEERKYRVSVRGGGEGRRVGEFL